MHLPWLKKVAQVTEKVIDLGAAVDPAHFGVVALVAHLVENALGPGKGAEKAAAFMTAVQPLIALLPPDKQATAQQGLADARDAYVAYKNAEAAFAAALAPIQALVGDVKGLV